MRGPNLDTMIYRSKSDLVAEAIRDLIVRNELQPGELLRQRDLAERFGVSPTPVREALRRLEAEGFVVSKLHRAVTVVRMEEARIAENFLIRATLEGLAIELATVKITDEILDVLEATNEEFAACNTEGEGRLELNYRFHFGIYEAADSPVLIALLNLLWRSLNGGPGYGRPIQESAAEHRRILDALRDRDGKRAADATRAHIEGGVHYETTQSPRGI